MASRNYVNGRNREYSVVHRRKKEGYIATRSAGSHSPIDVWAINSDTKTIKLSQCKPKSMSQKDKDKLLDSLIHLNGTYTVIVEVV